MQLQRMHAVQTQAAQAQAGGRVPGGYPMHAWQQLQASMNGMNGMAFRQGVGGQPHPNLAAVQAAQAKAAQTHAAQAQAQSQGAGAR